MTVNKKICKLLLIYIVCGLFILYVCLTLGYQVKKNKEIADIESAANAYMTDLMDLQFTDIPELECLTEEDYIVLKALFDKSDYTIDSIYTDYKDNATVILTLSHIEDIREISQSVTNEIYQNLPNIPTYEEEIEIFEEHIHLSTTVDTPNVSISLIKNNDVWEVDQENTNVWLMLYKCSAGYILGD